MADAFRDRLEVCNPRFRKLVGVDARAETMELELDRIAL